MSVDEVAARLGIARANGYRLVNSGMLPSLRRNGRVWVPISAVEARLQSRRMLETECITSAEVAEFFGVNNKTVLEWHRHGHLRATRISNILCFSAQDVVNFVPKSDLGLGRKPVNEPTRTLRGVHYPPPTERGTGT